MSFMTDSSACHRRQVLTLLLGSACTASQAFAASAGTDKSSAATDKSGACGDGWPAWVQFRTQFVAADGRVVDPDTPRSQTVSEAQAYGLFFALVGDDRASFDKILKWTEENLAGGDLTAHLPAWIWGRRDDGNWGVVDANSATDANLWIVYAPGEAARLWQEPRYKALSGLIAERLLRETLTDMPGLGPILQPAPQGFVLAGKRWRINPSYFPPQLMRWLAKHQPNPAWPKIAETVRKVLLGSAPKGFAPDWIVYEAGRGFELDSQNRGQGGYDAIRVYLWAGTLASGDPTARPLLKALAPMAKLVAKNGYPPEAVNIVTGEGTNTGPSGLSAALLPFLQAQGEQSTLQAQLTRLQAKPIRPKAYYEQALGLFGLGWHEGYYRFGVDGSLQPKWRTACAAHK